MPRPKLDRGELGEISTSGTTATGKIRARAYYRDLSGRRHQIEATGKSKSQAIRRLKARFEQKIDTGPTGSTMTWAEVSEQWLEFIQQTREIRPQSVATYRRAIDLQLSPALGDIVLAELTPGMLTRTLDAVRAEKPGVYQTAVNVATQIAEHAHRQELTEHNLMASYRRLQEKAPTVRTVTLEELAALRARVRDWSTGSTKRTQPLQDVADLILSTAIRTGEALALPIENVDLENRRIFIDRTQVAITGQGVIEQPMTKEGAELVIPLTDFGYLMLEERIRNAGKRDRYVFEAKGGGMISQANLNRAWRSARGKDFEWVTWKTFRKAVATLAAEKIDSATAAQILGHTSDRVTRRHYIVESATMVPDLTAVLEALAAPKAPERGEE